MDSQVVQATLTSPLLWGMAVGAGVFYTNMRFVRDTVTKYDFMVVYLGGLAGVLVAYFATKYSQKFM